MAELAVTDRPSKHLLRILRKQSALGLLRLVSCLQVTGLGIVGDARLALA